MYCYTYLSSLECALRELALWSQLSAEHPIFFSNVAQCLNINLTYSIEAELKRMRYNFEAINNEARQLLDMVTQQRYNPNYNLAQATAKLMQRFLQCDQEFLNLIRQLKKLWSKPAGLANPGGAY